MNEWIMNEWMSDFALTSNSQRKTHKVAQIRDVEPQKRQYTTIEADLHLFWTLT